MSKIVLDTNSLVQIISPRSRYYRIWENFLDGKYELCVSNEILNEYEEVIERLMTSRIAKRTIDVILNNPCTVFLNPYYSFHLIVADPDDNKFVDCAIMGNAQFIVTEDSHYRILKQYSFPRVNCIGLDDFYEKMGV